jgi:cytochrome c
VSAFFPSYGARAGRAITLQERINGCFLRSMNGKPIPVESAEMKAAGYLLKVTEFEDLGEVARDDIAPLGLKQLGPDYNEATFRAFRVVAERDPDAPGV